DGRGNFLNLRNVGAIRTLILLDGERLPPTTVDGRVDVDVVPEMLLKRVDIATSGVSAVYGSDAVTGVVNFVLDPSFTGVKARFQSAVSSRGDAPVRKAGFAAGTALLDGRGHATVSLEHVRSGGIALGERPLGARNILAVGLLATAPPGTAANPYVFAEDTRSGLVTPGGRVITGPFAILGQQFDSAGRVVPFDAGTFAGPTTQIGGSGQAFPPNRALITGGRSIRGYARLGYDLTDRLTASLEGLWSDNTARLVSGANFVVTPIFADNAFLSSELRAVLTDPGTLPLGFDPASAFVCGNGAPAAFCLVRVPSDLAPPRSRLADRSYTVKARLRGEIGGGWSVNAAYIHGRTRQRLETFNELFNTRLYAALDAVRAADGRAVCRVTLTDPARYPGCVPYNPFGFGANDANRAAVEGWLFGSPRVRTVNRTDDVIVNLTGGAGRTWAGPIRVAVGAEYRRAALSRTSNADPAVPQARAGIMGIDPAAPPFIITNAGLAGGAQRVKEANLELEVPLARDERLLHSLAVTGAARYTDYSTSGGVWTWKVGGKWEPASGLLLRAARSRDIRAPTLFDLFAGGTSQRATLIDVHCNCQPLTGIDLVGGGNPSLDPEIADSLALGIVARPAAIPGLSASVDFYDLKIRKAITQLGAADVIQACETAAGVGPACAAVSRPLPFADRSPANAATRVFTGAINAAALRTRGLDFDVGYSFAAGGSTLGARLVANRVLRYATQGTSAAPPISSAGVIDHSLTAVVPKWTGTLDLTWRRGPLTAHLASRYIDSLRIGLPPGTPGGFVYAERRLPAVAYVDAGLSRTITGRHGEIELYADAHNLLDRAPPVWPGNNLAGLLYPTYLPLYDVVGRFLTVGVRLRR
ncbi:MAG: TonB-dependent receptor, partial [Novosphingobium sp.]